MNSWKSLPTVAQATIVGLCQWYTSHESQQHDVAGQVDSNSGHEQLAQLVRYWEGVPQHLKQAIVNSLNNAVEHDDDGPGPCDPI